MEAVIPLLLLACSQPPALQCCGPEAGHPTYTTVPADLQPAPGSVELVLRAQREGVLPSTINPEATARSATQHALSSNFWEALDAHADPYGQVMALASQMGHPASVAAVPLLVSGYEPARQSAACERGYWAQPLDVPGIGECKLLDSMVVWVPGKDERPPTSDQGCRVHDCASDPRMELEASTRLALEEGWMPKVDADVAAGIHLLAVCVVGEEERPGHCEGVRR